MRHISPLLKWEKRNNVLCAKDGPLRYRIVLRRKDGAWVRVVTMNGATIGDPFPSVRAAIDYVEDTYMPQIDRTPLPYWKNTAGGA